MRFLVLFLALAAPSWGDIPVIRSAQSGPWSETSTWEGGRVPEQGVKVLVREGHTVRYDLKSEIAIRSLHIGGTLEFATDRDTQLNVGLLKIQPGEDVSEEGFDCEAHLPAGDETAKRPALLVGAQAAPVSAAHRALIRLVYFEGMDKLSCPAIVCCGGRMEFHGAEMNHTWVKLGGSVKAGASEIPLQDAVTGWKPGDHLFITGTVRQKKRAKTFQASVRLGTQTEERTITAVKDKALVLDKPLQFDHEGDGDYRAEVANLSRNVIVESAADGELRGHTMFHRGSQGGISYAEFRHLGKEGVLGRYSLHFHLVRGTMRGASVIGASIWDSGNRWITIHGTDYLVVRDCVGYQSKGHGFFLEDGTESFNVLDHNLAVQACVAAPLPKQLLPFDHNDGAGFWWANCRNSFTRNVAAECDEYGFRFDAVETPEVSMTMNVPQPDGSRAAKDIRTLPFVRFEGNEAHCMRRHSFNFGGMDSTLKLSVAGVGSDARHPFIVRDCKAWNVHWCIHTHSSFFMLDGFTAHASEYALWRMNYENSAIRRTRFDEIEVNPDFAPYKGTRPPESQFPKPLDPVDDFAPVTVITHVLPQADGKILVRGVASDDGEVKNVTVNGVSARPMTNDLAQWEAIIPAPKDGSIRAQAADAAGNSEPRVHRLVSVHGTWQLAASTSETASISR
ncbi:G8 domain-containing protein [Prosthecobacter sp.]|uniref:G8 domain-containing protein n=1 Tax=Prosthecobacter sp. TaxID=1965333 RepID=UPI001DE87C1A|nr:G8 domain-containing protein [Prosthecobacter sp.]MCB1279335.1 hypothetical protein [Prosthecobacter sp.]